MRFFALYCASKTTVSRSYVISSIISDFDFEVMITMIVKILELIKGRVRKAFSL